MNVRLLRILPAALVAALVVCGPATAADFTVNSTADTADATPGNGVCATAANVCTLRAAIQEANGLFGADTVSVPAGTYATASTLAVTTPMTITGAGARATVIDGSPNVDVIALNSSAVTLRGVAVTGGGTGVAVSGSDVVVDQVVVRGNTVSFPGSAQAGGIELAPTANLVLTRSQITGNRAESTAGLQAQGGGVWLQSGAVLTAVATTIAGNVASSAGGAAFGGGIFLFAGAQVTLRHVTLANNQSLGNPGSGGNIHSQGTITVTDTIIAGGVAGVGANCNTPPLVTGRNIDSGTTCGLGAGQLPSTDPALAALGDYGGPTDSMPPLGTAARDAASACPDGGTDQRGAPAPAGAACDIGAAEVSTDLAVTVQASRTDVGPGGDVTYLVKVRNGGPDPAAAPVLTASAAGASAVTVASVPGGTCTLAVRCDLAALAGGQEVTATVVVRAASSGSVVFSASASSALPDPVPGNTSAAVTTPVVGAGGPPPPVADTTRPVLGALRLTGRARTNRVVTLRATLSETATVTLRVERLAPGRRVGKACRVTARAGKACVAARLVGVARVAAAPPGSPTLTITRRVGGKVLAPGRYRVTATARDAAGNVSAARRLTVTVVK